MVSADSAARSARLSTIRYSSGAVNLAAAHAHRVDHRHAAGGDVVAVADAAGGPPADRLAEVGAGLLDQPEQRFRFGRHRLGRPGEAAVDIDRDIMLGGDRSDARRRSALLPRASCSGVAGRRLTRSTARSGHDIVRPAAVDPRRVDAEAGRPGLVEPQREVRGSDAARCGRPRDCGRRGPSGPSHDEREIAAARPRSGERSVGKRRGLVGQRRALAAAPPRRSAVARSRAIRLPRRC